MSLKRSREEDGGAGDEPREKRAAPNPGSAAANDDDNPPDHSTDIAVLLEQKKGLMMHLAEQRLATKNAETAADALRTENAELLELVTCLTTGWDAMNAQVAIFLSALPDVGGSAPPARSIIPVPLRLTDPTRAKSGFKQREEMTATLLGKAKQAISHYAQAVPAALERLAAQSPQAVQDEVAKVKKDQAELETRLQTLAETHAAAITTSHSHEATIHNLTHQLSLAQATAAKAEAESMALARKVQKFVLERAANGTAGGLTPLMAMTTTTTTFTSPPASASAPVDTNAPMTEAERLRNELSEAMLVNEKRLAEIAQLRATVTQLTLQSKTLQAQLDSLPEERVRGSVVFRNLSSAYHSTERRLADTAALLDRTTTDLRAQIAALSTEKEQIEKAAEQRLKELEDLLSASDAEILRLTSIQLAEQHIPQPSYSEEFVREQMVLLQRAQEEARREAAEVGRLREKVRASEEAQEQSAGQLARVEAAVQAQNAWIAQNPGSADFAAMPRMRPADLEEEAGERERRESEWAQLGNTDGLDADAVARRIRVLAEQIFRLKHTVKHLETTLKEQKEETEMYVTEMESTAKAYEASLEQNTKLLKQLSEHEEIAMKLKLERMKEKQTQNVLRKEIGELKAQAEAQGRKSTDAAAAAAILQQRIAEFQAQIRVLEEEKRVLGTAVERIRAVRQREEADLREARTTAEHSAATTQQARADCEAAVKELGAVTDKLNRATDDVLVYKTRCEKLEKRVGSSADLDAAKELEKLKVAMRCHVCSVRMKNVMLSRCFHSFCRSCIEKNYEARNRKCPTCREGFTKDDIRDFDILK